MFATGFLIIPPLLVGKKTIPPNGIKSRIPDDQFRISQNTFGTLKRNNASRRDGNTDF